jgi:hypothetical protein
LWRRGEDHPNYKHGKYVDQQRGPRKKVRQYLRREQKARLKRYDP